jgi:iron complex outermembrane receptor protein
MRNRDGPQSEPREVMKSYLLLGASFAALSSLACPAYGQETAATPAQQPETGVVSTSGANADEAPAVVPETIVVLGFRQANSAAIADKRNAVGITDGVNQDSIGLLPDLTVADIARRIPGVTAMSSTGVASNRSLASAEAIVIRGLAPSYNLTTFDGAPVATAEESNRAANLSLFPPTVISRVETVKTLTADLDPHGLSGQLNLITASAFDRDEPFGTVRLSVGENSTAGNVLDDQGYNVRGSGLYTTTFGALDQFGLVVSGSYEKFYATTFDSRPGGESGTYLFYTPNAASNAQTVFFDQSNGFAAPRRNQLYLYENEQERASGVVKLEWTPGEGTYASLFGGVFYQDEQEVRHEHLAVADSAVRPTSQTLYTGDWTRGRIETGYVYQPEESTTSLITGKFNHAFNDASALKLTGSFSRAEVDTIRNMTKFQPGYSAATGFSYDQSSGVPLLTFHDAVAANNPALSTMSYIRERFSTIQQDLYYLDGAYAHNFERDDLGLGWQVGATFQQRDQDFDRTFTEGDVFNTEGCTQTDIRRCPLLGFANFVADKTFPTTDPRVQFYLIDDAAVRAVWAAQGKPLTTDLTDDSVSADYAIAEQVWGAYGQIAYRTDRASVQFGLRYDSTKDDVDINVLDEQLPSTPASAQFVPATRSYEYDFLLPSVIGSYEATDNLLLRGAYTRTIGRPNFQFIKRGETIGQPDTDDPSDPRISISRGNPDLKPLVADNYDVSAEYYFDQGGSLISLAGFYKDVKDLIYVRNTEIPNFEYEGQLYTASIDQPMNSTDASIYGVELAVRKDFANLLPGLLSGFVFDGNVTWIGSEFTYINAEGESRDPGGWLNQPELLVNAQLSYEYGPFAAKVGYSWVDEYFSNILADNGDVYDAFAQPRGVVDLQMRYDITSAIRIVGEVQNLTEEGMEFSRRFPFGELQSGTADRGRVVWLGLNAEF